MPPIWQDDSRHQETLSALHGQLTRGGYEHRRSEGMRHFYSKGDRTAVINEYRKGGHTLTFLGKAKDGGMPNAKMATRADMQKLEAELDWLTAKGDAMTRSEHLRAVEIEDFLNESGWATDDLSPVSVDPATAATAAHNAGLTEAQDKVEKGGNMRKKADDDLLPVPVKPVGLTPMPTENDGAQRYAMDKWRGKDKAPPTRARDISKETINKIWNALPVPNFKPGDIVQVLGSSWEGKIKSRQGDKYTVEWEAGCKMAPVQEGRSLNGIGYSRRAKDDGTDIVRAAKTPAAKALVREITKLEKELENMSSGYPRPLERRLDALWDRLEKENAKTKATDGSAPSDHLARAARYEIAGDRARALDSYRAAASGFRRANDAPGLARAEDGVKACQAHAAAQYTHPQAGRAKVCDSADAALRTALERTRAGEAVRVVGTRVLPGRARAADTQRGLGYSDKSKCPTCAGVGERTSGNKCVTCNGTGKVKTAEAEASDTAGTSTRIFKDEAAARKYADRLLGDGMEAVGLAASPDGWEVSWHPELGFDEALKPVPTGDEENLQEVSDDRLRAMYKAALKMYASKLAKTYLDEMNRRGIGPIATDEHEGFAKLKNSLVHEKGVKDPAALAAAIGREKYGAKGMAAKSAAGRADDLQPVPTDRRVDLFKKDMERKRKEEEAAKDALHKFQQSAKRPDVCKCGSKKLDPVHAVSKKIGSVVVDAAEELMPV